jgi:hypothetical protein
MSMRNRPFLRRVFDDEARYLDRFGLLLLATTVAVVTLALIDIGEARDDVASALGQFIVSIFVGATLLLALQASGVRHRYQILVNVGIGIGVLAALVVVLLQWIGNGEAQELGATSVIWTVLSLLAPVLVIRRLLQHRRASVKTLLGALSAYLLIALAFTFFYLDLNAFGEPFFGASEPTTSYMYFSLVTITTLGYGDLVAVTPLGRLLATVEAVIGQVYLVTFVAMIVGLLVAQRESRRGEQPSPDVDETP